MNRRDFLSGLIAATPALAMPYGPQRIYSFARELFVPGIGPWVFIGQFLEVYSDDYEWRFIRQAAGGQEYISRTVSREALEDGRAPRVNELLREYDRLEPLPLRSYPITHFDHRERSGWARRDVVAERGGPLAAAEYSVRMRQQVEFEVGRAPGQPA